MTVIRNENNELIPTRAITGWRVCIDYRKLNAATRKDHFPLLFMDQMLERLAGRAFYCFLDGCMLAIFADLVKKCIEVFMDDFYAFGESFETCLTNLETVLERGEHTNLEFDLEIRDKSGKENQVADHLSRLVWRLGLRELYDSNLGQEANWILMQQHSYLRSNIDRQIGEDIFRTILVH
ncbi:PREDICTED: uncharacterized protein LOC109352961 [Lupinus angustifolius]|uniref:uncharacterized protein LOC109352961 n=1 Tax=Lupinus angustifolius TaxID=3871 RepID=UPI00092E5E92|nr:PREDICTED: uncharacterized protein LOC109352961 [Lupinus angustifolius]